MDLVEGALLALYALAGIAACALGALVLRADVRRRANRTLAAALLALGLSYVAILVGSAASESRFVVYNSGLYYAAGILAWRAAYALFLGDALPTSPLTRPLRVKPVRLAIVTAAGAAIVAVFLAPHLFFEAPMARDGATWVPESTPLWFRFELWGSALYLVALAAALDAYRRAPAHSVARARARSYAWAFGVQDAGFVAGNVAAFALVSAGGAPPGPWAMLLWGASTLAAVALLARALLRQQLLDIDLRLKTTLRQGTVATGLLALLLVAMETLRGVLPPPYGILAGVGAGVVLALLALAPLRASAHRLADAALPGVHASPTYLHRRRVELYAEALQERGGAGTIEPAAAGHDDALEALRRRLGLEASIAASVEAALSAADPPGSRAGALVGHRYRLDRRLGEGGQGVTWIAYDLVLDRPVVVKALPVPPGRASPLAEARKLAAVRHPHVVQVFDAFHEGAHAFLVMEKADGGDLAALLAREKRLPYPRLALLADQLLSALAACHAAGLVHGDVKPANVLLDAQGQVKLADFGLARAPGRAGTAAEAPGAGTLPYMAPEQVRGEPASVASDLYAAAAVLYEAATSHPYVDAQGADDFALRQRVLDRAPLLPDVAAPALRAALEQALAKDAVARFPSAVAFRAALAAAFAERTLPIAAGSAPQATDPL